MGLWDSLLNWLRRVFPFRALPRGISELVLQTRNGAFTRTPSTGGYTEDMIPTVGFNMGKVTKGNVTIKLRRPTEISNDMGVLLSWGVRDRNRYVVDAADRDSVPISRSELHDLLTKPSLNGISRLVLGNKIDKSEALSKQSLVDLMGLESLGEREVCSYMISCKDSINIDVVIDWLIKHSKTAQ